MVNSKFALNDLDAAFRKASERYSPYRRNPVPPSALGIPSCDLHEGPVMVALVDCGLSLREDRSQNP